MAEDEPVDDEPDEELDEEEDEAEETNKPKQAYHGPCRLQVVRVCHQATNSIALGAHVPWSKDTFA